MLQTQARSRSAFVNLMFWGLCGPAVLTGAGCRQPDSPPAAQPAVNSQEDQRSVFRQAIDQAKSLEKRINDRAIDPGEKGRIDEADPTGQKH